MDALRSAPRLLPTAALAALLVMAPSALAWDPADDPIVLGEDTLAYLDQAVADGWMDQALVDDLKRLAAAPDEDLHDSVYARYMEALKAAPAATVALPDCYDDCRERFDACKDLCDYKYQACKEAGGTEKVCSTMRQRCVDACEEEWRACMEVCDATLVLPVTEVTRADAGTSAGIAACEDTCAKQFEACKDACDQQYNRCLAAGGDEVTCGMLRQRCIDACENEYRACIKLCAVTSQRELTDLRDVRPATPAAA